MLVQNHKTTWVIDPIHTKVRFATRYLLMTYVSGWFTQIEGTVHASADNFSDAEVALTIYTRSIDTGNKERDRHLRSANFFHTRKYPQITFESTIVSGNDTLLDVSGMLRIKDAVVATCFQVEHHGTAIDPWGNIKAGFEMNTLFSRKDLNLGWNQYFGNPIRALLSDEVKVYCEMQLLKLP